MTGVLIISIDTELIWGFNHLLFNPNSRKYVKKMMKIIEKRSRKNIPRLLELTKKYNVAFTWAVVGHIALESCECPNGIPHPDMPRPEGFTLGDWYANDPCSNYIKDPLWYGPDIVEQIVNAQVPQDIGCHSFSHVNFSEASADVARAEIRKCKEVLSYYGVVPRSFVYPRNIVAHAQVLAEEGFISYRFKAKKKYSLPRFLSRKILYKIAEFSSPILADAYIDGDIVAIPGTFLYQTPRVWEVPLLVATAKRGILMAAKNNRIFHITFHEYLENDMLLKGLDSILGFASRLREKGLLKIMSMSEYASYFLDNISSTKSS